ncbi:hypothetical protein Calab_1526 [Caldithrix abyssi DSM 13497]|uniref:Uncharacterized protein n=1 Tax=Caldithrix abyssi DSM 13497 TaxID=880073 RepID=H1XQK0_CALAY|nr:hypothetical protein [Caldithrix abyssi]APF20322.1 hypothetical protein Cabys_3576 [Caldithrix abyssi DSM 13497]EHO41146.1 hypothetical protein Calab_1526 [Caldithrix abyssi DSM 13497]
MARNHKSQPSPAETAGQSTAQSGATSLTSQNDARSTSAGRRFVFEFYELDARKIVKTVEISVKAKEEKEAWQKLGEKLAKDTRILEYSGRFYIKDA